MKQFVRKHWRLIIGESAVCCAAICSVLAHNWSAVIWQVFCGCLFFIVEDQRDDIEFWGGAYNEAMAGWKRALDSLDAAREVIKGMAASKRGGAE